MKCIACGNSSLVEGRTVTEGMDMSFRPSGDSKLKKAFGVGSRSVRAFGCTRCGHLQFAVDFSEDDLKKYQSFEGVQQRSIVEQEESK